MILLIEILSIIVPLIVTFLLYLIYYYVFIIGYVKRVKKAIDNKEFNKVAVMKNIALKKQPIRMDFLFRKYGVH